MEDLDKILTAPEQEEKEAEVKAEVKPKAKKAVSKKAEEKAPKIAMEDMQKHYEERVRNHDNVVTIFYAKAFETIRGFASSVMFSGVTYSFRVGFSTPVLKEHVKFVNDWLNETHKVRGSKIEANTDALAMEEARQIAGNNQG